MRIAVFLGLLIACFATTTTLQAQRSNNQYTKKSDAASVKILKQVHQKYAAYKSMKMTLKMTMESGSTKETQTATVFVKGKKFKMTAKGQEMISDGKTLWNYQIDNKELYISEPTEDEIGMFNSPDNLLKTFEKDFISALVATVKEKGRDVYKIEFKPKSRDAEFSKIRVTIDKATKAVKRIKIFDKSNTHYTIEMSNVKPNASVSNAIFTKDLKSLPKGVEVIDLR